MKKMVFAMALLMSALNAHSCEVVVTEASPIVLRHEVSMLHSQLAADPGNTVLKKFREKSREFTKAKEEERQWFRKQYSPKSVR